MPGPARARVDMAAIVTASPGPSTRARTADRRSILLELGHFRFASSVPSRAPVSLPWPRRHRPMAASLEGSVERWWMRAAATATALGVIAGAVALTASGSTTSANRPVRALGANGGGSLDVASGGGGAKPGPSRIGRSPHRTASLAALRSTPPSDGALGEEGAPSRERRRARRARRLAPRSGRRSALDQADEALQTDRGEVQDRRTEPQRSRTRGGSEPLQHRASGHERRRRAAGFYLQMVNVVFAIYDADTGAKVEGPIFMSSLFDENDPNRSSAPDTTTETRSSSTTSTQMSG